MKVCIFGTGAIGGHFAVRLLHTKAADVSLVARGATLEAIRSRGLTLRSDHGEMSVRVPAATDDPSMLPPQDLVVVTMKAPTLPDAATGISRLIAPQGCALFVLNGIPWWWNYGLPGARGTLSLLDPQGILWNEVRPERVLGCVIQSPNDPIEPGLIVHTGPNQMIMGEPDNAQSARLKAAAEIFTASGIEVRLAQDIRREIWRKLVQNASGNALSALSRLTLSELAGDADLQQLMVGIMNEILAVAAAVGWDLRSEFDTAQIARRGAARKSTVRSSMLRDVMEKRPLEVDTGLGQVQAFAREARIKVPIIDTLLPLLRGLDRAQRTPG